MPRRRATRTTQPTAERERLLKLLRLTASDRDGEALAALRRATRLMERLELDWDRLLGGAPLAAEVLAKAMVVGRASGLREGRAEVERARERAFAEGLAAGRALGRAEGASSHRDEEDDGPALADVVNFRRRRADRTGDGEAEHRRRIAAVLANPRAPPRTMAFVGDLRRWLDMQGPLTPAQRAALERTYQRWGLGAA